MFKRSALFDVADRARGVRRVDVGGIGDVGGVYTDGGALVAQTLKGARLPKTMLLPPTGSCDSAGIRLNALSANKENASVASMNIL